MKKTYAIFKSKRNCIGRLTHLAYVVHDTPEGAVSAYLHATKSRPTGIIVMAIAASKVSYFERMKESASPRIKYLLNYRKKNSYDLEYPVGHTHWFRRKHQEKQKPWYLVY